jgi:hypothetical protein
MTTSLIRPFHSAQKVIYGPRTHSFVLISSLRAFCPPYTYGLKKLWAAVHSLLLLKDCILWGVGLVFGRRREKVPLVGAINLCFLPRRRPPQFSPLPIGAQILKAL